MLNGIYPIKKALYLPYHSANRGSKCENKLKGSKGLRLLTFTFDPFFNVKWGYLTIKPLSRLVLHYY